MARRSSYLGVDQTGAVYIATAVQASKDDGVTVVNSGSLTFYLTASGLLAGVQGPAQAVAQVGQLANGRFDVPHLLGAQVGAE